MSDTTLQGAPGPSQTPSGHHASGEGGTRRDFLYLLTGAVGAVGVGSVAWPLIDSMNPSKDVLALASVEVDLSPAAVGQSLTVKWRGKPVFIRHRPEDQIKAAEDVDLGVLPDPQPDSARVQKAEWLVVVGVCTHLGCIPLGQNPGDNRGPYGGWFCPCHGSIYDTSGRIRQGPAPANLVVPTYAFTTDTKIKIG
ncbi:MAG TPA: ubiquinol-cytochrome c reductase iron-sulfur subunit [Inquilinus sp.]|nr:ubiquinol-cytochrome c reductase iron-sulfur subunit [Inquilinus sp.]